MLKSASRCNRDLVVEGFDFSLKLDLLPKKCIRSLEIPPWHS